MRAIYATALVPVLVALLTWLSVRAINTGAEHFDQALNDLDRFAATEATLRSNTLAARAGLVRNYDPLVRDVDELHASIRRIRMILAGGQEAQAAIDNLAAAVKRQEELTEQFKSNNALLQNSLAYFARFSAYLCAPDQAYPLAPAVSALAVAMLRLTLDTSPTAARDVQDRLDELTKRALPSDNSPAAALLAHARLLSDLLPATDDTLKALGSVPSKHDQDALHAILIKQQLTSRETAREFRLVLYVVSLLLLGLVVFVGWRLRSRARALRRRAAFEHVLAGISMSFVSARESDIATTVTQALAAMAQWIGADRAYFLVSDGSEQTYTWCRPAVSFPPDWPDRAFAFLSLLDYPAFNALMHIPNVERLPPGASREATAAADLKEWACVSAKTPNGAEALVGFDAVSQTYQMRAGELGLLRMGLDTIINALGRLSVERERTRLSFRLEQARRLETVGTLASGVAHNFNNIIGAILGYVETAAEQQDSPRILDEIRRACERARDLVDQILTYAGRHDARNAVDIKILIAETTTLLRASLPAEVEIAVCETAESISVLGVSTQLQQAVLNLCNNAAQAMDYAGRIKLNSSLIDLEESRHLSHGTLGPGRYVCIAVSDSGRGMDQAIIERLFEPFFTTRPTGNGLGLATTGEIIREHGGAIEVQSTIGLGSRIEIWLPSLAAGTPPVSTTLPFGQGEVVLMVETDTEQLLRDEEMLAALGYEPVGFSSETAAWAASVSSSRRFDLILLKHTTSRPEVLALATRLHEVAPNLPILLATSSHDEFDANELLEAGIADVVHSPLSAVETAVSLRDCLRRKLWNEGTDDDYRSAGARVT